jgi:sec-independent protein translocase protein TatA
MSPALPLAFFNSAWGWIAVLFIALLLFGARLPKMARNMGKGINEFKKGLNEGAAADDPEDDEDDDRDRPRRRSSPSSNKTRVEDTGV